MEKKQHKQPQIGTYVTMITGLLLLFLLVSQAGKYHNNGFIVEKAKERAALNNERHKAMLKIGATQTASALANLPTEQEVITLYAGANTQTTTAPQSSRSTDASYTNYTTQPVQQATNNISNTNNARRTSTSHKFHYRVRKNETLYRISMRVYGNGNLWRDILKANPQLKNPGNLKPGMRLSIPSPDTPNSVFRRWMANTANQNINTP